MKSLLYYLKEYTVEIFILTISIAVLINNRSILWP